MMDNEVIIAAKKKRKQKTDNSFENVQHIVIIQIYYGEKAISSLTFALELSDFQDDNLTTASIQIHLLEAVKIRLNEIKEFQERGDDVNSYDKQSKKEIKKEKKNKEILLKEQNDIDDLHQSMSDITPRDLALYDENSFKFDTPLEFKDLNESLETQKKQRETALAVISQTDVPFNFDLFPVASFICQIKRPEKKLGKMYEKYNVHVEIEKREKQAALQANRTSTTEKNLIGDSDSVALLENENEDEKSTDKHRNRRCQIL